MQISNLNFYGDPNVGMYLKASDRFCLAGNSVHEKDVKRIESYLSVEVKKCFVANTEFIGLFSALNSNGIILPKLATDNEIKIFEHFAKGLGINFSVIDSKFSALGNLVLCNDRGALASRLLRSKDVKNIEDCLGAEVVKTRLAGTDIVGSCGVATNKGCLLHRDSNEKDIKLVEDVLKVNADIGTANFGSPFVGSCMIANSNGALVGDKTTAPELQRIIDALNLG
ncbi:MAG: translation initiation factor IF-6 [Candidatus Aenigmarchaeota archaeon]|nr:translation initiation factor IF-6 [Candidatus Aenigmarchaeota archaeon]